MNLNMITQFLLGKQSTSELKDSSANNQNSSPRFERDIKKVVRFLKQTPTKISDQDVRDLA
jgi:hypothetical protein